MIRQVNKNKVKVYVAMSGGVDSSVAAALLKKEGYDVVGVFMKSWDPNEKSNRKIVNSNYKDSTTNYPDFIEDPRLQSNRDELPVAPCLWKEDREYALRVASVLGISLLTWDFSREYKKEVGDYMIREYRAGRTPNPDVMCNKEIKFGLFLKKALREGADFIATGHYVRIRRVNSNSQLVNSESEKKLPIPARLAGGTNYQLFTAKDKNKDQSYFLWTLTQEKLKHCLFPIGNYVKPEVRKLAKKFGLPNHDKKDSQGVCFIGPLDMKQFLIKYIKNKKGRILDPKGNLIGTHDGVYYYTIGQRRGLDIKNGQGPYYVTNKDVKKNIVYVGKENDLGGKRAKISDISWINKPKLPAKISVMIRYRSKSEKAILSKNGGLKLSRPIRALTSGQSAVFYKGDELLGGGIIN